MKWQVWITKWCDAEKAQIKVVAGQFNTFFNAKLFADAYANHYKSHPEIVEAK